MDLPEKAFFLRKLDRLRHAAGFFQILRMKSHFQAMESTR